MRDQASVEVLICIAVHDRGSVIDGDYSWLALSRDQRKVMCAGINRFYLPWSNTTCGATRERISVLL